LYTYFETLDWDKKPDGKYFRVSFNNNEIVVDACLGYQPGGWMRCSVNTFELFKQAGIVEVTLEHINEVRKRNGLSCV